MRDMIFRGKDIHTNNWIEGYLYVRHDGAYEISYYSEEQDIERHTYEVNLQAVGQYIGRKDKNGNKILEKDIVRTKYGRLCVVEYGNFMNYSGFDLSPFSTIEHALIH